MKLWHDEEESNQNDAKKKTKKNTVNTDILHLLDCDGHKKRRFKTSKDQATDDGVTEETAPGTGPAL